MIRVVPTAILASTALVFIASVAFTQPKPVPHPGGGSSSLGPSSGGVRPGVVPPGPGTPPSGWQGSIPSVHYSTDVENPKCETKIMVGLGWEPVFFDIASSTQDLGRLFPEWWDVGRPTAPIDHRSSAVFDTTPVSNIVVLEGTVVSETETPDVGTPAPTSAPGERDHRGIDFTPHVTHDDMPISHFTHDLNVHVLPDVTPDNRFTNLRGIQVEHPVRDPCRNMRAQLVGLRMSDVGSRRNGALDAAIHKLEEELRKPACAIQKVSDIRHQQHLIEVEWETGLAADNDGNVCAAQNRRGDSCGFASAGHTRGKELWNWPTEGDHVHIEGEWIWDRGHPPADTEIHPPRLMAVQRKLPDLVAGAGAVRLNGPSFIATRADIFANGDGTAFVNNTKGPYANDYGVRRVPMSDRDYTFAIDQTLARPTPTAVLRWTVSKQDGDSFAPELTVTPYPDGNPSHTQPHVMVSVPWRSQHVADSAVLARTIHLYWDDAPSMGVAVSGRPRIFSVTLDALTVVRPLDGVTAVGSPPRAVQVAGDLRFFAEVGGHWLFLNELFPGDILRSGLGKSEAVTWPLRRTFTIFVPPQGKFRLYAGGWEADAVNGLFGQLSDPNQVCSQKLRDGAADFASKLLNHKGLDDPTGEVAVAITPGAGKIHGLAVTRPSVGNVQTDPLGEDTDPTGAFTIQFHVDELDWPPKGPDQRPHTR